MWTSQPYDSESIARFDAVHEGLWPDMEAFIADELDTLVDAADVDRLRAALVQMQVRADWLTPCMENHEDLVMDLAFLDTKYEWVAADHRQKMERRKAEVMRRAKELGKSDKAAEVECRLDSRCEELAVVVAAIERFTKFVRALSFSLKGREAILQRLSYRDRPE